MVDANVLNGERFNVRTGLLVQYVFEHRLVHGFTVHFQNRLVTALGFIHFVGEGIEVLTRQNRRRSEDTQRSTAVVPCFRVVSTCSRIEFVVDSEVAYLVVAFESLSRSTVVILNLIVVFKFDDCMVQINNFCVTEAVGQELDCERNVSV